MDLGPRARLHALRMARALGRPTLERELAGLLMGAPRSDQEVPVGGCPLPPAQQRDLGVDEASKVCDQQAELPPADSVQWRARSTCIDRGRSAIRRRVPATRARPSERSPADRQVTAHRHGRGREPCSPIAARSETPLPTGTANACAEIRLCGAWHRVPAVGRTLLPQPPPHAAIGRRERVLSSALMPGCPARGRRSQTSTGPTLLRSQPTTSGPRDRVWVRLECGGVEPCVRFTRASSNSGELEQ